jgi:hypothetical protein
MDVVTFTTSPHGTPWTMCSEPPRFVKIKLGIDAIANGADSTIALRIPATKRMRFVFMSVSPGAT